MGGIIVLRWCDTRRTRALGSVLGVSLAAASAYGQTTTSLISGSVQDPARSPLAGTRIEARHLETGLLREATTDREGRYTLPGVPVGAFEVKAVLPGFRTAVLSVTVVLGEPVVLSFSLEVAASEAVTVTGNLAGVKTRSGELGYLVSEETIRELPLNGRNYTDLASLQPGVVAFPFRDGGSVVAHGLAASVNGQDPRSNVYLIDGTLMNDITNSPAGSAAGTALGTETVREFRVEVNAYGAEFGRNTGGQINVLTKSGTNSFHGTAYEYHRNDALDARNFFDPQEKPAFRRNQFGLTVGGPVRKDRTFFFVGYEGLREDLGRTISTVVPNLAARSGVLPDPTRPGATVTVSVSPAVRPYLDEFPLPNGADLGQGLAAYSFPFAQTLDQDYFQARLDQNLGSRHQLFVRYTFDRARQLLPTDFPQFPRTVASQNQFATAEYRHVLSTGTLATVRLGYSRTRIGQEVEARTSRPLAPFVPGRSLPGDIDIGGIPRFGPQSSADLALRQDVFAFHGDIVYTRGRHLVKGGGLLERYEDDMSNGTFSLGIFTFPNLESFLRNRPQRFIGLTPEGDIERNWRFTLLGLYLQDDVRLGRVTLSAGARYEYATVPKDTKGRDVNLKDLLDPEVAVGRLYENPTGNVSPRFGFAWDVLGDGRTSVRGGYGLYFNTNNQQNLIVTVTNPPATPRPVIANPAFPTPDFGAAGALSIRPFQYDLEAPRLQVWNLSVQRQLVGRTVVTVGYAGARGRKLLRNADANVPTPSELPDGSLSFPAGRPRPNRAFSAIERKTSDGDSWYNALVVELRRASHEGLGFQASYTFSRNLDTTQASTFFSDATNGTVSAFPEFGRAYNKGPADYEARHNLVANLTFELPFARQARGLARALFSNWQVAAIGQYRSGPPLTVFVQSNRSRSLWSPSQGPGIGFDRPDLVPGRTPPNAVLGLPDQWFDRAAFALQPAGRLGNLGRGALRGPDLRTLALSLVKRIAWRRLGEAGRLELRMEAFNVFNRANFGIPSLVAFAGQRDGEPPLSTFGRIRATSTSARQIQMGVRVQF
jgi:hypothetical protein